MKKIATLIAGSVLALGAFAPYASAYGGGPSLPPGFTGDVVCTTKTFHLPFGGSITIPWCRPGLAVGWDHRLSNFFDRVVHGHGHHAEDTH